MLQISKDNILGPSPSIFYICIFLVNCLVNGTKIQSNLIILNFYLSDDSLSDDETKTAALSASCMQKVTATEESCNSVSRKLKTAKKAARQAQLKR